MKTSLFGGARLSKDDVRIEAYGTVDELNCGRLDTYIELTNLDKEIQKSTCLLFKTSCFNIGSVLAVDPSKNFRFARGQ